jgi:Fuc2NAc and GlcNAc transferase
VDLTNPLGLSVYIVVLVAGTAGITYLIMGYAHKKLMDIPNHRSSHEIPTPRGGGIAMVISYALALIYLYLSHGLNPGITLALAGGLPIAIIGFIDDHRHVSARLRLMIQILAAAWSILWLDGFHSLKFNGEEYQLGQAGNLLAILLLAWLVNLFNFMDGIDGIAASEVIFVGLSAFVILMFENSHINFINEGLPLLSLAAASLGFLFWNWPPARIFMGDVGSGVVGFLIGVSALYSAKSGAISLVTWLILLGTFYVDASFTLAQRILSGQKFTEAHRSHAYQKAARLHGSHKKVTLTFIFINLFWLLPLACAAATWPKLELMCLFIAYMPLVLIAQRLEAGKT